MSVLRPFFTYYGGKWRIANSYPAPVHDTIIEPFAGSAGYAMRHAHKQVMLYDLDPMIVALWRYLIGASERRVRELPDLKPGQHVDDLRAFTTIRCSSTGLRTLSGS